jgi:hypothetical protein
VPLGVHALDEGIVVLALRTDTGTTRRIRTHGATHEQAGTGTNRRALITADGRAGHGTDRGSDYRAGHCRLPCRLIGTLTAGLIVGILPTKGIVFPETLDALAGSRQDHHARPGRHHGTSPQQSRNGKSQSYAPESCLVMHRDHLAGSGKTFCQPSGHSLT